MFKVGTELRYRVTKVVDGRPEGIPYENVCRVLSVNGDSTEYEVISDFDAERSVTVTLGEGNITLGSIRFDKVPDPPIQVEMGDCVVYVDTLIPAPRCGGAEALYLGRDGIIYKDVRRQLWFRGVVCDVTYKLVSITVDGVVYEGIRWVEDGESPDEDEICDSSSFDSSHL